MRADRFCLRDNLINPAGQIGKGAAQCFFGGQKGDGRRAARRLFEDRIGRAELEAIRPMPIQA
jgi:hypothetical protein